MCQWDFLEKLSLQNNILALKVVSKVKAPATKVVENMCFSLTINFFDY